MYTHTTLKGLHDAELTAFDVDRNDKLIKLSFCTEDAVPWTLELQGFTALRGVDLIHQNVVSRFLASSEFNFSEHDLEYWIKWVNSLTEANDLISDEQIDNYKKKILSGSLMLIVLEPSLGFEFAAICRAFSLTSN